MHNFLIKLRQLKWWQWLLIIAFIIFCMEQYSAYRQGLTFQPQTFRENAAKYDVDISRDNYGVPFVYGKNDIDVAFGSGYVQAEDRLSDIEEAIKTYRGIRSKTEGRSGMESDYFVKWLGVWDQLDSGMAETQLSAQSLAILQAFADGINAYAGTDVNRAESNLYPITAHDLLAGIYLQHLFFYGFDKTVAQTLAGDLDVEGVLSENWTDDVPIGSNAIAVSPTRTSDGSTLLSWNSHQPLTGPVAWYEINIQSETGWNFHGGSLPGNPIPSIGFNDSLAWGVTVNKPDLVDVIEVPESQVKEHQCRIDVKVFGALSMPWSETCYSSSIGPVMKIKDRYVAFEFSGDGQFAQVQQWYDMTRAKSVDAWLKVMKEQAIASFNFVLADSQGNIGYLHNALMPDRAQIPWHNYLAVDDLPQQINPAAGVIVSANQTPFKVTLNQQNNDVKQQGDYQTDMTNRALRGLALLAEGEIDLDRLKSVKYDTRYAPESKVAQFLNKLEPPGPDASAAEQRGYDLVKNWNLSADMQNKAAGLSMCTARPLFYEDDKARSVNEQFAYCVEHLNDKVGRLDRKWGALNRLVHKGEYWPVDGGPDLLRATYGDQSDYESYGINRVVAGDGLHGFVRFDSTGKVTAEVVAPFGQSNYRKSKHITDQAKLFSQHELRKVLTEKSEIEKAAVVSYRPSDRY